MSWRAGKKGLLALAVLAAVAAAGWAAYTAGHWRHFLFETPYQGYITGEVLLRVPPGAEAGRVAADLERAGIIPLARAFRWQLDRRDLSRRIQAGTYRFDRPLTLDEVIDILVRGRVAVTTVTLPEGWAGIRMFDHLEAAGLGRSGRYLELWGDPGPIRDLDPGADSLEGYLFPDTYQFPAGSSEETVVAAMLGRFRQVAVPALAEGEAEAGFSRRELLTLASLVEKETGAAVERAMVASVLTNRLRLGMPLQCDPTVIYAEWLEKGHWDGEINQSDLRRDSPYNTYLHRGLPPGPICNPGLSAIRAAVRPARTSYLYFVSRNDGSHIFSSDLRSHNNAVRRYQR